MERSKRRLVSVLAAGTLLTMVLVGVTPSSAEVTRPDNPVVTVEAVTVSVDDGHPVGFSSTGTMSDDGRLVVISSTTDGLIEGVGPGYYNYMRDRAHDTTSVITARSDGTPVPGVFKRVRGGAGVTGDGRYAVITWDGPDLSPTGTDPEQYVYLKDLSSGALEAFRAPTPPGLGDGQRLLRLRTAGTSQHGRFIAGNAILGNQGPDREMGSMVFLLNSITGRWRWITPPDLWASVEAMSDDGRYVVYERGKAAYHDSAARFDRVTGKTRRLPDHPDDELVRTFPVRFSDDGRIMISSWYHPFTGRPSTLIQRASTMATLEVLDMEVCDVDGTGRYLAVIANPDNFRWAQVYRYDRFTGRLLLVSRSPSGRPANYYSIGAHISAKGNVVSFTSYASNLVPGDIHPDMTEDREQAQDGFVATIDP